MGGRRVTGSGRVVVLSVCVVSQFVTNVISFLLYNAERAVVTN